VPPAPAPHRTVSTRNRAAVSTAVMHSSQSRSRRPYRRGAHRERLSQREQEVLALVRRGRSNKQIARELCLELATVKNHMHNAIVKLNVRNRFEAAAATRDG
jgi:DNA-binding NarL/FixJ family response regulator